MLLPIPEVLTAEQAAHCRRRLEAADWVDGRGTAGHLSHGVKDNQQLRFDNPVAVELGGMITRRLETHPLFMSAALPHKIVPPLFNRYATSQRYGDHVDGAIRPIDGTPHRVRTDLSATLFLSELDDYDGGELVIEDTYGTQAVKLPAGDMIVYPATSLHRVNPVTRGSRWGSFFWTQSMIKDDSRRRLLFDMDMSIIQARQALPDDHPSVLGLTACYHNLMRMWCEL